MRASRLRQQADRALEQALDRARARLSSQEGVLTLAVLGLLVGLATRAVIVAFRQAIELGQGSLLPGGAHENYEALDLWARLLACSAGGLLMAALYRALPAHAREVGVVHLMERLAYHQGHLPLANAVAQFAGAVVAIASGQSVGREGPGVHLGAATGSQLARAVRLPNNAVRTLVSCGVAASIGASFNTPLAGVIFAMEVVVMEYTIGGFIPVLLSAVSGTTVARMVYGDAPAFSVPPLALDSLWELPLVLVLGAAIGVAAAAFIRLLLTTQRRTASWPGVLRLSGAGVLCGVVALGVPQIMGIGYDTVTAALLGDTAVGILLVVGAAKLAVTAVTIGAGVPGGLIGPTLVIGTCLGGALAAGLALVAPGLISSPGLYAMLGMGAMMAATLQAPLAALTALLELTLNPHIILPGMLAVVSANLVARRVFGTDSIFLMNLRARGLDVRHDPVAQSLRRVGVSAAMERRIALLPVRAGAAEVRAALAGHPRWIIAREGTRPISAVAAVDVARQLEAEGAADVDLASIPAERRDLAPVALEATLQEALERFGEVDAELLYVTRLNAPGIAHIYGVLTREDVEGYYRY